MAAGSRVGTQQPTTTSGDYSALEFVAEKVANRASTATLARVVKVTSQPGSLGEVGRVDVLPLVNQVDGRGNPVKHTTVYSLPYFRYQGGGNAVIIDPRVGDVGLVVFADRDISSVKSSKQQSNPGSRRRFDMSDGIYVGVCLGGSDPDQYIRFTDTGLEIRDKNGNSMIFGPQGIQFTSTEISNSGEFLARRGSRNIPLSTHVHPDPQGGKTGLPEP